MREPIVIAHRGASGYRPEHTLAAYRLAIALGADYVEPDLVPTKDGVLVARHEAEIGRTTDVARRAEFGDRLTTKEIDGREVTGWFVEDFTLEELKSLRAVERLPGLRPRNTRFDGRYDVPTFDEVLGLVTAESERLGREVGVYPEIKHPSYFARLGLATDERLLDTLATHGYGGPTAPVFVQCFEPGSLQWLRSRTGLPLVQLVGATGPSDVLGDLVTPTGLRKVAGWADALGVEKDLVLPRHPVTGAPGEPSSLVADAHAVGLAVHVWTMREEYGDSVEQTRAFLAAGVDGLFTDQPDTTLAAVRRHRSGIRIHAAT
jgi:glycerophosphoryl diester phosphodiesterase